jgi:segregation and condensation protein A
METNGPNLINSPETPDAAATAVVEAVSSTDTGPASENPYSIKVPIFEGPLDLLLHLIRQNKIDIYDIPIAEITGQYLQYIEIMKEFNLEIASEFLVMAATLIYIKSRMLLPPDETIEAVDDEDPRAGLVERLLEYQAFKEVSAPLRDREVLWSNIFSGPVRDVSNMPVEPELYLFEVNLFDLMGALKNVISKVPPEAMKISRETLTVKDRMALIIEMLEKQRTVRFDAIFEGDRIRLHVIVTFLALLEILRLGLAGAYQDKDFGVIWIMRKTDDTAGRLEGVPEGEGPGNVMLK